jgi:hypothetical protein
MRSLTCAAVQMILEEDGVPPELQHSLVFDLS